MARRYWAGLDVGAETTSVCVMDDRGAILHEAVCATSVKSVHFELRFLRRRRFVRVGLESGMGTALARGLRNLGYAVDIYEARKLSKFLRVRRDKTDAGDANGIAEAGRLGSQAVTRVYLKDLDCQTLGARLTIRRHLIRSRTRTANLLGRQLEQFGGRLTRCYTASALETKAEAQFKKLFGKASIPLVAELRYLLKRCTDLIAYQREVDRELKVAAKENELCRRLMEIPGVGPICALSFVTAIGEPERFRRLQQVGSYLGLSPRLHQSGLTMRMGRISKMGHRATRCLLVQASLQFLRWAPRDCELHIWASALEQRRGRGRARVALARKLATIMLSMWKTGERYQPRLCAPA